MSRMAAVPSMLLAVLLAGTTACSDSSGPKEGTPSILPGLPGLVVSAPVPVGVGQGSLEASAALSVSASVTYVSLAPGSVPDGRLATIRNQATAQSVIAAVVNGGFDPVAIIASIGDTLLVEITRSGSGAPLATVEVVRARPPVVVRTDPPKKQVDVPLNAILVVVFSAPIDPATLTTAAVQLWRGSTPEPGTVRFADAAQLRGEFHPDNPLAPDTDYRFVVTQGIRDVNGQALAAPVEVPFTTGTIEPAKGLVFASVSAGGDHTCAIDVPRDLARDHGAETTGGAAYCWGSNHWGVLGVGDAAVHRTTPVAVWGGLTFATVSAGGGLTCGLTSGGAVYCWGWGYTLGSGDPEYGWWSPEAGPQAVSGAATFATLSAGWAHICGVTPMGAAYCWGENGSGQLGNLGYQSSPVAVPGGLTFAMVSAGFSHTCGVTPSGVAYCWGDDDWGQLGDGSPGLDNRFDPVAVLGGLSFATVSAGEYFTCGVTTSGAAYCWGENSAGQLGDGSVTSRSSPVAVSGGLTFAAVSVGGVHACGVTTSGAAYCWGRNYTGQLGDGSRTNRSSPVAVLGGLTFAAVSADAPWGGHTCGVTTSGAAYCWGGNSYGQLGNGTTTDSSVPVKVAGQP